MLKGIFGGLLKPLPTDWEKFSQKLANPERHLTPGLVIQFQDYHQHPIHCVALTPYAAVISGAAVGLLNVQKDHVVFHAKDGKGTYSRWQWDASVDGVLALNARAGIGSGHKSGDKAVQELSQVCFGKFLQSVPLYSAEAMSVKKALTVYNQTIPRFMQLDPELKIGIPH